ncbi:MBL fold metallo-hydrolase [Solwaraspora sp. WMMD406]|uniref:MBL fold metallo-hydrolase n=1 Tax=Solwaraspora sp. WMMD406 TaxID=3016095 RepID=UPI002417CFD9|nr:MBL fold metallo-hydrolase [Solwaraspora sp. WMMD406]MDG4767044.1 MBL fold metallo-hydrolase [Solwaraspora sp. WMMD406]
MSEMRITHIGGPTTLIEVAGWRILTDPTFDDPGRTYRFGWGTASRKLAGPAVPADTLGHIDVVLLTHDHHADNLDDAGRALLPYADRVVTTMAGSRRLGAAALGRVAVVGSGPVVSTGSVVGLAPWGGTELTAPGRPTVEVTATPCRHGPPLSRPVAGEVTGFALRWPGQRYGVLWITGDTVLYPGVRQVAQRFPIGTMVLHLGAVRFGLTGPLRYTMTAADGVELCALVEARTVVPVHYEGWDHFTEGRAAVEAAFTVAPEPVRRSLRWLTPGTATPLPV